MFNLRRSSRLLLAVTRLTGFSVLALTLGGAAQAVDIEWVTVGDPGNACDQQPQGCFGGVEYTYRISKYEVTNAQYAEFLNAVAATDTYALYHTNMANPNLEGGGYGGITRSGSAGSYTYSAIAGREDMPVNHVDFYDALRFANWLHNGEGTASTETGAYTLLGANPIPINWDTVTRNAEATIFLPSEDEWYKAAYYAGSGTYYDYPAGSDAQTTCAAPGATANTANCAMAVGDLTDVKSYTGSTSPNGTFDQGGNVWEWNEAILPNSYRGLRGGTLEYSPSFLAASFRFSFPPTLEGEDIGFRVAMIPEPPIPVEIDIRPWSEHNFINPFSRLLVPVALLGSDDFDVADVDVNTLTFGPPGGASGASPAFPFFLSDWDLNNDDEKDLVSYYRTEETGIAMGDTEACLTGETQDGTPFEGCDVITTVPCGHGFEAALVVPPVVWVGGRMRRRRR